MGTSTSPTGTALDRKSDASLPVLDARGLRVVLRPSASPPRTLVRDISMDIHPGEIVCMVGESGSGKSLFARAIMGLASDDPRLEVTGRVDFGGRDVLAFRDDELRSLRGVGMTMVFQEPMASLDPVMRVGTQVVEAIRRSSPMPRARARERASELFTEVGLPDPSRVLRSYPHELSGGMCQRVMIAMALAPRPKLLVADEPTTALDVTVQAQILTLLMDLRDQEQMSILLITHDMAVAAAIADRVVVVYAGRTVEAGPVHRIFTSPRHPYTAGLLRSLPRLGAADRTSPLPTIPGAVPEPGRLPSGCAFWPRCERAVARCHEEDPPLETRQERDAVACFVPFGDD